MAMPIPPMMDPSTIADSMINGPKQVVKLLENIDTRLQEIRDAVILQNCISALAIADSVEFQGKIITVEDVLAAARGYTTAATGETL